MGIIARECKKVLWSKSTMIMLLILCIVNAFLLYSNEKHKGNMYTPEQYRACFAEIEDMSCEEAYEFLINKSSTSIFSESFAIQQVIWEVESQLNYYDYLKQIEQSELMMSSISIFEEKDAFTSRNTKKTAAAYRPLTQIVMTVAPSKGIAMCIEFGTTDILMLLFMIYIVLSMVIREKEQGQLMLTFVTRYGRSFHGVSKLITCFMAAVFVVFFMVGTNLLVAYRMYGLGTLERSIQSVTICKACVLPISVEKFLMLFLLFKIIAFFCIGIMVFIVACICESATKLFTILTLGIGIEGILYFYTQGNSYLSFFKYVNVIAFLDVQAVLGRYINLNIFGYPVWYFGVFVCSLVVIVVFGILIACVLYVKQKVIPKSEKIKWGDVLIIPQKTVSLFWQECYKVLLGEKVLWILLACITFQILSYRPMTEYFASEDDMFYKQYMLQLEGEYSEEKQAWLNDEKLRYEKIRGEMMQAIQANPENQELVAMRFEDKLKGDKACEETLKHAEYLKKENGAFLYDTGYRIITNDTIGKKVNNNNAVLVNLLMILCTVFICSSEHQTGMNTLNRVSYKGRRILITQKVFIGSMITMIVYCIVYLPFYYNVFSTYGIRGGDFPLCSMEHMAGWKISIFTYLIILCVMRYISLLVKMLTLFGLSGKLRSSSLTILVGIGLYVGPLLVFYLAT